MAPNVTRSEPFPLNSLRVLELPPSKLKTIHLAYPFEVVLHPDKKYHTIFICQNKPKTSSLVLLNKKYANIMSLGTHTAKNMRG